MDATMSEQNLSFQFKIDTIIAKPDAPPQLFTNGFYKPPVRSDHYKQVTMDGVSPIIPSPPNRQAYSTSIFYDGYYTKRFLFHPADCRTLNISDIERNNGERWGWRQLCFTERSPTHSVLDLNGEYDSLRGQPGSYSPYAGCQVI